MILQEGGRACDGGDVCVCRKWSNPEVGQRREKRERKRMGRGTKIAETRLKFKEDTSRLTPHIRALLRRAIQSLDACKRITMQVKVRITLYV